jgi:hypothetical protein
MAIHAHMKRRCLAHSRNNGKPRSWRRATLSYEMRPSHQSTYMNYETISEQGQLYRNGFSRLNEIPTAQRGIMQERNNWYIDHLDVVTAFLKSTMMPCSWIYPRAGPTSRVLSTTALRGKTWKLESSDYEEHLTAVDFVQSKAHPNLYI